MPEASMSVKDKLEIGLKPDAPYRRDNLPEFQKDDPDCEQAAEEGEGPRQERARENCDEGEPGALHPSTPGKKKP
jgi:hypothetical protein